MNKVKVITYIAIGLLLTNFLLIGFMVFKKPPRHEGPKRIISERLHFEDKQIDEYEKLIAQHQFKIRTKDSLIRLTKNELYKCIQTGNMPLKDSLESDLGKLQVEIEDIHYNHFIDIKNLCRGNQIPYFNDLVKDLAQLFAKEPMGKPKR